MPGYTEVYLFRHGEALNNVQSHLIGGRGDATPLVENGISQARQLGRTLLEIGLIPDEVYSSPAERAIRTGEIALQAMGLELDIIEDERLHEQDTGDWTGHVAAEIFTDETVRTIEASGKDFRSPNGESMNDVGSRMLDWLESLKSGTASNPHIVFAFTHGGAIRSLASEMLDWTHAQTYQTRPANTSASTFKQVDGLWRPESIGIAADELEVNQLIPAEIACRLAQNERIRERLASVIWFGSMRNNQDVYGHSDYDVQVILDEPVADLTVAIGEILKDYPDVDLSIMYLKDIFDHSGNVIFQDGTKGPFFMHVLGTGKIMYGRNVYAEAVEGLTLEDLQPAILFTVREYLSRLRVMAVQTPDDSIKFKKYSTKLFKDLLVYTGMRPIREMPRITNAEACKQIMELHEFGDGSLEALAQTDNYGQPFTVKEMAQLLDDYEKIIDRICNE